MPGPNATPTHVRLRAEARHMRLIGLGYADYAAYLRSSAWAKLKRRYIEQQPWICNVCGKTDDLHLHHKTYERVGQEELADLMPLCQACHAIVHELERRGDADLDFEGVIDAARALAGREMLVKQREDRERAQRDHRATLRVRMETLPIRDRIRLAQRVAARRYVDVSREMFMIGLHTQRGNPKQVRSHLARMERHAYGPQYWVEP